MGLARSPRDFDATMLALVRQCAAGRPDRECDEASKRRRGVHATRRPTARPRGSGPLSSGLDARRAPGLANPVSTMNGAARVRGADRAEQTLTTRAGAALRPGTCVHASCVAHWLRGSGGGTHLRGTRARPTRRDDGAGARGHGLDSSCLALSSSTMSSTTAPADRARPCVCTSRYRGIMVNRCTRAVPRKTRFWCRLFYLYIFR